MTRPRLGYVICATPRSGSNYLCELLASTGVLGRPLEYFNPAALRLWGLPDYPEDRPGRLAQALSLAATENGVYGLKIFTDQFDDMAATGWVGAFPDPLFVYLRREDLLGQALSRLRAQQTWRWRSDHEGCGDAVYDADNISASLSYLAVAEARWRVFFARNALQPLALSYEALVRHPQAAVSAIAAKLGLSEAPTVDLAKIAVGIQRDKQTAAWRERFLRERASLDHLDRPALPAGDCSERGAVSSPHTRR